jgi:2-iminobutanoate/2-iminopropanoate deaminase
MKQVIATVDAPPAIGPYAQGIKAGDMIFVSGQIPLEARTRRIVSGGIAEQTEQVLSNIRAVVEEAGASMDDIVKITVFLKDLNDFDEMNRIYSMFFPSTDNPLSTTLPPARSTIEVSRLPRDVSIEMDAIAVLTPRSLDFEIY